MKMDSKSKLSLPKLRFKGFYGEYSCTKIKEIVKIFDGPHKTPKYFDSGIPFYSVETITNNYFKYIDYSQYEKFKKIYSPKINDILFTRIGIIGKTMMVKKEMIPFSIYVSICALRVISSDIKSIYLNFFINSNHFIKSIFKNALLTAVPIKINIVDLYKLKIYYPKIQEQEKIGIFFTKIDKLIKLWERKLE